MVAPRKPKPKAAAKPKPKTASKRTTRRTSVRRSAPATAPAAVPKTPPRDEAARSAAQRHSDQVAARSRRAYAAQAEIGPIPPVADPERRESCRLDLYRFLQTYFPESTGLSPFSEDHRRVILRLQMCILEGGRFVNAVYRGFAKTTISENAAIWATIYGHRRFGLVIGISKQASAENLESIKAELAGNDLLMDDFPEVCLPIVELDGKPQRCKSQTCGGEHTNMRWRADGIVLPTIEGSAASGAIISTKPYSKARGAKFKRSDGANARPDFAIIDDPQDDESAATPGRVNKNLKYLKKGIIPTAGHAKKIALVINATVIAKDDMIEQLLKDPAWQGERISMVKQWATAHDSFWLKDYADVRQRFDPSDPKDQKRAFAEATVLYASRRAEADAGCLVSWEHCYDHECEISAIQHAYNALIDDGPEVFTSEYQNQPVESAAGKRIMTAEEIAAKQTSRPKGEIPKACSHLTAFIDVHQDLLYWAVCAWQEDFTGYVVDYGTSPDQHRSYFTLRDAKQVLSKVHKNMGLEGWVYAGLDAQVKAIAEREFRGDSGGFSRVGKIGVDANWGQTTATVKQLCRQCAHAAIVLPTHGHSFGPSVKPISQYQPKPGERLNREYNWYIPHIVNQTRHILFDTNWWKTFVHARLATAMGDHGCLSLFASKDHRLFADHLTAEVPIETEGRGRKVDEWKLLPGRDNHWFDCIVGCAMLASVLGCRLASGKPAAPASARQRKRQAVAYL